MLIMAGTLCKAGIEESKAREYLVKAYPQKDAAEIDGIIKYSYERNAFGSDRRRYIG